MPAGISGAYRQATALSFTAFDIAPHPDGGVVLAGSVQAPGAEREAAIAHLDDAGGVVWARRTSWPTNDQYFSTVVDGATVYGIGMTRRDMGAGNSNEILISTFDLDGTYSGSVAIGDPVSDEHSWGAIALSSGGLAISGYTNQSGFGDRDGMLLVVDDSLQPQWAVAIGGAGSDQTYDVVEDDDGGLLVVGDNGQAGDASQSLLAKFDIAGALQFSLSFGGAGPDVMRGAAPLSDGRYLVVGETGTWGAGSQDGYFGIVDPSAGSPVVLSTLGGPGYDVLRSLVDVGDGRFVAAGQVGSVGKTEDAWLARLETSDGLQVDWQFAYVSPRNQRMLTGAAAVRSDGGLAVGVHDFEGGASDFEPAVLYTDSLGGMEEACPEAIEDPFPAELVQDVTVETVVGQQAVGFAVYPIPAAAEPVIAWDLGPTDVLCQ